MSYVIANNDILSLTESAISVTKVYDIRNYDSVCYQLNYTDAAPPTDTFVAADVTVNPANTITITAHGYTTGIKVALTGTNLPAGLSATNYWIIRVDADTIKLASSLANAVAGTAVHITSQGTTADATLTPITLATTGQVLKLQESNDGVTFFDVSGLTVTITASGNTLWQITQPATAYHKFVLTPTTGAIDLDVIVCGRAIVNQ